MLEHSTGVGPSFGRLVFGILQLPSSRSASCAGCPLQLIQNTAAPLVLSLPTFSHTSPLLRTLHRPRECSIRFKSLVLVYHAANGCSQPTNISQSPTLCYCQTAAPSLRGDPRCRSVHLDGSVLAPQWRELPADIRTAETLPSSNADEQLICSDCFLE